MKSGKMPTCIWKLGGGVVWVLGFGAKVLGSIPVAATKIFGSFLLRSVRGLKFAQPEKSKLEQCLVVSPAQVGDDYLSLCRKAPGPH